MKMFHEGLPTNRFVKEFDPLAELITMLKEKQDNVASIDIFFYVKMLRRIAVEGKLNHWPWIAINFPALKDIQADKLAEWFKTLNPDVLELVQDYTEYKVFSSILTEANIALNKAHNELLTKDQWWKPYRNDYSEARKAFAVQQKNFNELNEQFNSTVKEKLLSWNDRVSKAHETSLTGLLLRNIIITE